jgi:hypothetical protein
MSIPCRAASTDTVCSSSKLDRGTLPKSDGPVSHGSIARSTTMWHPGSLADLRSICGVGECIWDDVLIDDLQRCRRIEKLVSPVGMVNTAGSP